MNDTDRQLVGHEIDLGNGYVRMEYGTGPSETPVVSVNMITYNHAPYIAQAIEGAVGQKTDFPFEILLHDDASTDGTADICMECAEKYPDIIRYLPQSENQYSQGIGVTATFQHPRVRGKYIAWCEGDDYWCNEDKLTRQVDALNRYPEVDFCFHPALAERPNGKQYLWRSMGDQETRHTLDEVLMRTSQFAPTASYLCRYPAIVDCMEWMRERTGISIGDFFMEVFSSRRGGSVCLPEPMCVRREAVPGSWTERHRGISAENRSRLLALAEGMLSAYNSLEPHLPEANRPSLNYRRAASYIMLANCFLDHREYAAFRENIEKARGIWRDLDPFAKLIYHLRRCGPLARWVRHTKNRWRHGLKPIEGKNT